jgi:hypothetical protein
MGAYYNPTSAGETFRTPSEPRHMDQLVSPSSRDDPSGPRHRLASETIQGALGRLAHLGVGIVKQLDEGRHQFR